MMLQTPRNCTLEIVNLKKKKKMYDIGGTFWTINFMILSSHILGSATKILLYMHRRGCGVYLHW